MKRVAILTNILPFYRQGFYDRLFAEPELDLTVYCQANTPGSGIKTIHERYGNRVRLVRYQGPVSGSFTWQWLPFREIYRKYDVVFVDGNPRILSHALLASALRLLGKRVVVWSMVHSFRNRAWSERMRIGWLRTFPHHFLYNDTDVQNLRRRGFGDEKTLLAMNNGLDQTEIDRVANGWPPEKLRAWQRDRGLVDRRILVTCGRLAPGKYTPLAEVLPALVAQIPDLHWICIGDGPDRDSLERWIAKENMTDHVTFTGALFTNEELAPWLLSSDLFIHPTAVGLSIMTAFGFGLPIVTHHNAATHGPEFVAFREGLNGVSYREGSDLGLQRTILRLLAPDARPRLDRMKGNALKTVRKEYNVEVMANRFLQMVQRVSAD